MEKIELKVHKPKQPRMTSIEETIQLARIQQAATTSALYERKHNQKALKVLTVAAYILFVSMAAITLSFYYVFIWDPSTKTVPSRSSTNCDNKVVIPESLAIRLANSTEITAENFFKNIFRTYQTLQKEEKMVEVKELTALPKSMHTSTLATATPTAPKAIASTSTTQLPPSMQPLFQEQTVASPSFASITEQQNHQPDDDDDDDDDDTENDGDYEASGIRINWNDTTILLDEEPK